MPRAPRFLMVSPEAPYPLRGGGALRTACLLHYLARISPPDLVLFSESGLPALIPEGLVRSQRVIPLPRHGRGLPARFLRNALRAFHGVPPLIDRVGRLTEELERVLGDERWDTGIVEHFWCAPYVDLLKRRCNEVVLDLHNVESVLHQRAADYSGGLVAAGHRRFAAAARRLEVELLPRFSLVLAASETDADLVKAIAPGSRVAVYPNACPVFHGRTGTAAPGLVVFSANFEYHPNVDAVRFLMREIWPEIRRRRPDARLRLVGRGDEAIRHLLPGDAGVETTGPVEDASELIAEAEVAIAPLRIGSGTRLKIVEAWAAGRAVVATPLAAEGLRAVDGANILLAEDGPGFAAAVCGLLGDAPLRTKLGGAGQACFSSFYSWNVAWRALDGCLQPADSGGVAGDDKPDASADILGKPDAFRR